MQKSNKNEIFMERVKNSNNLKFCTQLDPSKTRKVKYFFLKYVFIFEKNELFAFTLQFAKLRFVSSCSCDGVIWTYEWGRSTSFK